MKPRTNALCVNVVFKKRVNPGFDVVKCVRAILKAEKKKKSDINIIFTSNSCLKQLNAKYRHKNKPTDVLSFPILSDKSGYYGGDIFISLELARENAASYKATLKEELARLVIHGVLHVIGYDHIKKSDEKLMKPKEEKYLKMVFKKAAG